MDMWKQFQSLDDTAIKLRRNLHSVKGKIYKSAASLSLPDPTNVEANLSDVLYRRSSKPSNKLTTLNLNTISNMCFWSKKSMDSSGGFESTRYPTAGGFNCLELYLVINRDQEGLSVGVYHYQANDHILRDLSYVKRDQLNQIYDSQRTTTKTDDVYFIVTADTYNLYSNYGLFAHKLMLVEAGHLLQNLSLTATACGINTRLYSFGDYSRIQNVMDLPTQEIPIQFLALV